MAEVAESNDQYGILIDNLKKEIDEEENDEEKVNIYIKFLENYMMPMNLWLDLLRLSDKQDDEYLLYTINPIYEELLNISSYYFLYTGQSAINEDYPIKIYENFVECYFTKVDPSCPFSLIEEFHNKHKIELMFPHPELRQYLIQYEKDHFSPLPNDLQKHVEEMEKLYVKIKASEEDPQKWLNYLREAKDPQYLKQNVENRLLKDLSNIKLWKCYIEYWRETDPKEMLQVLSKYCRRFLDDSEMKVIYKNEVKNHGPVYVKWKNPFEFENVAGEEVPKITSMFKQENPENEEPPFECPKIDYNSSMIQDWSIPRPTVRYIASQTWSSASEKLLQTCKYFMKQNTVIYCYKATFVDSNRIGAYRIKENSIQISLNSLNLPPMNKKNLYISTVFIFKNNNRFMIDEPNSQKLSLAIKTNIYQCDAKFIEIKNQKLTESEFKFLVGHGNVKHLKLDDVAIFKNNEEEMTLDEIFAYTPKLQYTYISNRFLHIPDTISKLMFSEKLVNFHLGICTNIIDGKEFCDFLKKYAAPCSRFSLNFHRSTAEESFKIFNESINNFVNQWNPENEKPKVSCHRNQF